MGRREDLIKKRNEEWGKRKTPKKHKNDHDHPWYTTNWMIKGNAEKIYKDVTTSENRQGEDLK